MPFSLIRFVSGAYRYYLVRQLLLLVGSAGKAAEKNKKVKEVKTTREKTLKHLKV